ncbi:MULTISPECIES: DUF1295 domain-containing protein [unclassified Streptomyces]|uniref:DUF1295 domain-containing protein n=1 Tax=unclassified Streptomyces TaxID=2593676 RepID=UPI003821BB2D
MNAFAWSDFAANLGWAAATALAVMLSTFAVALAQGMHRVVDVAWGAAFVAVALVTFVLSAGHGDPARRVLVTGLTVVWGLRLAARIARRGSGDGEDPRYEAMTARASGNRNLYALRTIYLLQGSLVWLVSLPVQAAQYTPAPLSALAWAGTGVWAVGLFFETVGDAQLARFKADPAHRGRIMDRGLWRYTRHPNYFGDFCVWWGLFLVACDAGWQPAAASVLSPLAMSLLLTKGSGKRLLERHMATRPGWPAYAARTSGFFPRPPRSRG